MMRYRMNKINKILKVNILFLGIISFVLTLFVVSSFTINVIYAQSGFMNEEETKNALLVEDWQKADELLINIDTKTVSPVARLVKGHTCIVFNRNNESLEMFLSVREEQEYRAWKEWTTNFAKENSDKAITFYLKADALARLEEWEASLDAFNKALELNPEFYLAFNARGVVNHILGKTEDARNDFYEAANHGKFLDAYINWGTMNVLENNTSGAERAFKKAPDSLLARNGLGCVFYGKQDYEKAKELFESISQDTIVASLAMYNSYVTEIAHLGRVIKEANNAGMSLERSEGYYSSSEDGPIYKVPRQDGGFDIFNSRWEKIGTVGVPPKEGEEGGKGEGEGEGDGKGEGDKGNTNKAEGGPIIRIPRPGGGWIIIDAGSGIVIGTEGVPPKEEGGGEGGGEGQGEGEGDKGSTKNINPLTIPFPDDLIGIRTGIITMREGLEEKLLEMKEESLGTQSQEDARGVTMKPLQNIRVNRGNWLVRSWYSLGYLVDPELL